MADDPQLRRSVLKLKIQLKNWEKSFEKVNGRKPNRDDIKRAGSDVKEMYKRFWFYKANPGLKYNDVVKKKDDGETKKVVVPKQSTSGIAFFEDSVVTEETTKKGNHDEGDPIMSSLMASFKSNKKSFSKNANKNKPKKVLLLEVVPESPEKEESPGDFHRMDVSSTFECEPKENTDSNAISRSEFIRKMFHGEEDDLAYKKEMYEEKADNEIKLDEMFEGCTLLPVDWKPKAATKRKVTSKKKSAENFIRLDMKHKSFASKGYKKFNVQKYKRKQHRKLRRDKCFCCGESGHWANECPMKLKKSEAVDEDGIPILSEDQIIMDEDSDDLVVKIPSVVYSNLVNKEETTKVAVPEMSRSEKLFMSILNDGKDVVPKAPVNVIINNFAGSSFGSSGESIREASNESRGSLQYNLFDEDDMMEEFLGKEQIDDILATI